MQKSLARLLAAGLLTVAFIAGQATWTLAGTTATIHGNTTDDAGHALAGVQVSAVSPSSSNRTASGANGFYALAGLPVDTYAVTFSKTSYATVTIPGITLNQDQNYVLNVVLHEDVKTIGRVAVRGSTSLVQPTQTADTYTVNPQTMTEIAGSPQTISETAILNALPGITTDNAGYPIIRGGAENEEGYQLEGIDATEPYTGQFINSLSLAGTARLQLSTGGYDVSQGNTNAGVINEVIKRGAYPGSGQATARTNAPNFDHRLAFEYGNGTPDGVFSYFYAFSGIRQFRIYGDPKVFIPETVGATGDSSGNINTLNTFYRWGSNKQNELQYFAESGASTFIFNYGTDPSILPYATNNPVVMGTLGPYN
ncbi:MAG: carboxypeptidase-like regulatory domain-containing protein, partial [Candidatus Eremiobacteraeota bacterium]|nr:carboxypeptidase-like regulatory domain-containing protein [Candidatus Eremiobacteraeota bacterium]